MSAGRFNHWVTFEVFTGPDDGSGGHTTDWDALVSTWAEVRPASARQLLEAGLLQAEYTHTIRTWYRADLLTETRALRARDLDGLIYALRTVRDADGRRITVVCDGVQVSQP